MSTDKNLADVQPGGRVRLGSANIASGLRNMLSDIEQFGAAPMTVDTNLIRDAIAALSAKPSPGGQGAQTIEKLRAMMDHSFGGPGFVVYGTAQSIAEVERRLAPGLAARQPVGEPVAWMARPVLQSARSRSSVFCSDSNLASQWDYSGHPEYGRMTVTPLYAAPTAQAVDLGQFRRAVRWAVVNAVTEDFKNYAEGLLALIDSHGASNG